MAYSLSSFDCGPWVLTSEGSDQGMKRTVLLCFGDILSVMGVGILLSFLSWWVSLSLEHVLLLP